MKRTIASRTLLALSIGVLTTFGAARTAPAKSGCSNATLKGSYGLHATGTVLSGPLTGPLAFVGILTFDGAGQLTVSLSQRLSSGTSATTLIKVPFTGTYSVNADCTVEDMWTNTLNGTSSVHESVIVDRGQGLFILNTTIGAPNIVSAVVRKQFGGDDEED